MGRILITGIEGFVGQHLARHLAGSGDQVIGIHYADAPSGIAAECHHGDVRDFEWMRASIASIRPDAVVHLAAVSSVLESEAHVVDTYQVNAIGTLNLLEAVRTTGVSPRILLISSADVYGRSVPPEPLDESSPAQPISPYALSKVASEDAGRFFSRAFGTDVVILRPFSHTGPGQRSDFVFPTVASRIAEVERAFADNPQLDDASRTIELGNLDVRRDYTDVRDIARAYGLALQHCRSGETYVITSGNRLMIREGVEMLRQLARCEVHCRSSARKRRDRDLPLLTGNPTKFARETGWKPQIPIETTMRDLLDYYRNIV